MSFDIILFICMLIMFCANALHGISGFGRALLAIPLLSFFLPISEIVPTMIITGMVTAIYMFLRTFRSANLKKIMLMSGMGLVGAFIGVRVLKVLPDLHLKIALGIIIMGFAILIASGFSFSIKREKFAFGITGLMSGFLSGSLSIGGPPVVVLLQGIKEKKDSFRGNISLFFAITTTFSVMNLLIENMVTSNIWSLVLWLLPANFFGIFIGNWACKHMNEMFFRRLVIMLLFVSGMSAVVFSFV